MILTLKHMQAHESPMQSRSTFFLNRGLEWSSRVKQMLGMDWGGMKSVDFSLPSRKGAQSTGHIDHSSLAATLTQWFCTSFGRHPKNHLLKMRMKLRHAIPCELWIKTWSFFATKLLSVEINTVSLSRSTFAQKNPGIPFHSHTCPGACSTCMGRK